MFDVTPMNTARTTACGPVCLKMLLDYYGIDADLENLITECNVGVNGCTAADIKRTAEAYGLSVTCWKMDAEELIRQDRPGIIWWKYHHFVVFDGRAEDGKVFICNPSSGRFRMDVETFSTFYSEIAIFVGTPETLEFPTAEPFKALKTYLQGEIIRNGTMLYIAREVICEGETVRPGVNATVTTVDELMNAIQAEKEE